LQAVNLEGALRRCLQEQPRDEAAGSNAASSTGNHNGSKNGKAAPDFEPPVDMERLLDIACGEADQLRSYAALYLHEADAICSDLHQVLAVGDARRVQAAGHKLAGASGNCGITAIAPLALELERVGAEDKLDRARELHGEIQQQVNRVREFFNNHPDFRKN
jgi:HPt (histidine-containing phosphotransfer) domain-containing protein